MTLPYSQSFEQKQDIGKVEKNCISSECSVLTLALDLDEPESDFLLLGRRLLPVPSEP